MMNQKIYISLFVTLLSLSAFAQPTHTITDTEKDFKDAKTFFINKDYAFAYPLLKTLMSKYNESTTSDHAYLNEDIQYYYIVCELQLQQEAGKEDAIKYLSSINNQARRQLVSFYLSHYFFVEREYTKAIENFDIAGYDNLSNEQIADAKFEKAYAYFNLNQYTNAKPLFDEIHQLPDNKYFIAANYYYGVIAYKEKQYESALGAFKAVENVAEYKGVVPYYIAEIYYLQGNKESALQYGESILNKGIETYYNKQLSLLIGQLYFEKADYKKGLPLLEEYVNSSTKVSKEILYELSYSYYKEGKFANAIEGFKQLSNEKDSMGQNSMYVLGDLYLRTNNKANARTAFQYAAANNSNAVQQKVAKFNYAKLSYELGYQDVALNEMRHFIDDYPNSIYDIEAKEILVNVLANTNNFREALQLYQSFDKPTLAMQKAYPRILFGRAVELVNDQQLNEADQLLSTIINSINAGNLAAPANFWKGEIAYRQQRYDEAIRFTTAYLQSNAPASGEANATTARYNTAYSFYHKENYQQALIYFQQITKTVNASSSPIEQDAYLRSADCYFMLRDFAMADKLYESIISVAPGQAAYAMFQKGMIAGIKNSNEKIRILNALNKQYPANSFMQEVNMEIANTYIANEKFGEALPYLKLVLSSSENGLKPKAWLKLGLAHYNNNNNKEALAAYQQLLEKYPQSAESEEAMANIKDIYLEEGKPDEYLAFMKKNGITVSVSEADSLSYTAAFLRYQKNDCAASITALTNYLQNYPDGASSIEANYYRALCYKKNREWQKAIEGFAFVNSKGLNKFYEAATLEAAQLYYFELKDYANAKKYFELLRANAVDQSLLLEAYRGLVRSYYQLKDYSQSNTIATELLNRKGISTDDRSIGLLVLAKSQQQQNDCPSAITTFKQLTAINKSAWGAEARYEIANCYFTAGNFSAAEKAATQVIKETGSYDWWVTKSYILLGDIFLQQKDYFNAKATFESVAKNAAITELKNEAQQKLELAVAEEKQNSKIGN